MTNERYSRQILFGETDERTKEKTGRLRDLSRPLSPLKMKFVHLKEIIIDAGSAVVAFSGGVDSTFLLKACKDALGENVVAVTARSETFPARELESAVNLAGEMRADHVVIDSEEMKRPGFTDNPPNRCFICKTELFSKIKRNRWSARKIFSGIRGCAYSGFDTTMPLRAWSWGKRRCAPWKIPTLKNVSSGASNPSDTII